MEAQPKLICKTEKTHITTDLPVYYFGTPHAKVYAVYSISWGGTRILVAAILEEFSYHYREDKLYVKNRPVLIPEAALNGDERMEDIHTANFDNDRLNELIARSFLNEALAAKLSADKLTRSEPPEGK